METHITNKFLLFLICISAFFLTGCKGSAGKKAATEALEILEKKGSSVESTIEREATQIERSSTKEVEEGYSSGRSRRYRPRHNSYEEDEPEDEPQMYTVQCSQCGGSGAVYMQDYYGNIQYDSYGNPLVCQCPSCGGSGTILVSE